MDVVINGKFFGANLEGMPRVGREVVSAFDDLLGEGQFPEMRMRILTPRNTPVPRFRNIPVRAVGWSQGVRWEQLELPLYLKTQYLLNFTGTGPVIISRGCTVVHDAQFRSTPGSFNWKSRLLYGIVTPIVARRSTQVITVSQHARNEIRDFKVTTRPDVAVVYNGVDHVHRREGDQSILIRLGLRNTNYMLASSYAHAHKNVGTLLSAMHLGAERLGPLILFGTHTENAFRELGISLPPNVIFAGRVTDEELISLMKAATVFLCPSTTEGFGLPPLEAMALGCPAICAHAGAMPEVCGSGALYASPFSPDSWFQQITRIWISGSLRAEMVEAGRIQASRFSWRAAADQYLSTILKSAGQSV